MHPKAEREGDFRRVEVTLEEAEVRDCNISVGAGGLCGDHKVGEILNEEVL